MSYLINGSVILMLLLFFSVLSIESKTSRLFIAKKTVSGLLSNCRIYYRQLIKK